ncbi:AAA family ATPase [Massilia sp. GCM10023247]|uniref:hypothetical protein n=1 Tax=Massilia sp. GCM10023247 TaxID=3252643 RepID=UPI0036235EBD
MNLQLPSDFYSSVLSEIDTILCGLKGLSSDKDVSKAKNGAVEIFEKLSGELRANIEVLGKNAEWDRFTIAFYGETNAGKSTIIETMRILLAETCKLTQQEEFRALQEKYGASAENLARLRADLAQAEQVCAQLNSGLAALEGERQAEVQEVRGQLNDLQQAVRLHKETASLWQKLLDLFIELPQKKQIAALETHLQGLETSWAHKLAGLGQQQLAAQQQYRAREQALKDAESSLAHLEAYADGSIIGNGRSDFTLDTTAYAFTGGEQEFALLDVPGIEGKEAKVTDAICLGVQKAHAVFYVANKPAPPQKGDEQNPGTLEKIRQHLGAQTEVWTIYNKRVTNPMQLAQLGQPGDDEQASLRELDRRMEEVLADKYRGSITLSAFPAFLGAASCLVPGSPNALSQAKFLAKLGRQDLLERSGASAFRDLLVGDLVKDFRAKITRSNYNKVNRVVRDCIDQVCLTLRQSFRPLAKELRKDADQARLQLDTALDALKTRLDSRGQTAIAQFTNTVRKEIYARIDDDIDNDDFKDAFERLIEREQARLVEKLPAVMQAEVEQFQVQIGDIVERFQAFAAELIDAYGDIRIAGLGRTFDLKIDIDNGLNVPGLLGALVGGALLFWNPAGWVLLAVGAITVLVGAVKAVIGFFSSDYRKAQQRKAADANLEKITAKMRESLRDSLEEALPQLEPKIEALKAALDGPADQVTEMIGILGKSERQLRNLSYTIETAGAL